MRWRSVTIRACVACQLLQGTSCKTIQHNITAMVNSAGMQNQCKLNVHACCMPARKPRLGAYKVSMLHSLCAYHHSRGAYRCAWMLLTDAKREGQHLCSMLLDGSLLWPGRTRQGTGGNEHDPS